MTRESGSEGYDFSHLEVPSAQHGLSPGEQGSDGECSGSELADLALVCTQICKRGET